MVIGPSLTECGPWEPGTLTLVAVSDGTRFSYRNLGVEPRPRRPRPGELVNLVWSPTQAGTSHEVGVIIAVDFTPFGSPRCLVLWPSPPDTWDPQF